MGMETPPPGLTDEADLALTKRVLFDLAALQASLDKWGVWKLDALDPVRVFRVDSQFVEDLMRVEEHRIRGRMTSKRIQHKRRERPRLMQSTLSPE
jgi:hypothetical protein